MRSSTRAGSSITWRPIRAWRSPRAGIGAASCKRASMRRTMLPRSPRPRRRNGFSGHRWHSLRGPNTISMARSRRRHSITRHRPASGPSIWRRSPATTRSSRCGRRTAPRISRTAPRWAGTTAHAYLRPARYCYLRWGADGKVRQLDQSPPPLREEPPMPSPRSTIGVPVEHLDLATVVRVSQAVSGEIVLEKLIDTLMVTALEHAGAERGLLILPRGDELRIEAEATTDRGTVTVRLLGTPATP